MASEAVCAEIGAWRSILRDLQLLGQEPGRYGGFGFGNISVRDTEEDEQIIITASQTSGSLEFSAEHLTRITGVNFRRFWVDAEGHQPPSSETVTHAMLYAADKRISAVIHVHSPQIWDNAAPLGLPTTGEDVAYGTPAMVEAVRALLEEHQSRPMVFATLGHEDGVFSVGHTLRDAGVALITVLARARCLPE